MVSIIAGQRVRAAELNSGFTRATVLTAYKAADTARLSFTTVTADPELVLSIPAGRGMIVVDAMYGANGAGDLKVAWGLSTGLTMGKWTGKWRTADGTEISGVAADHTATFSITATASTPPNQWYWGGGLITATQAGTVSFAWAQVTTSVNPTTIFGGSVLRYQPFD